MSPIAYSPKISYDGLVGYWDAANVKSYPGSGTIWRDLSGNGNHGTLSAEGIGTVSGSGTMIFNGASDYIGFGDIFTFGTTNFTISHWYKGNLLDQSDQYTIGKGYPDYDPAHRGYVCRTETGSPYWFLRDSESQVIVTHGLENTDVWGNVVLTIDRDIGVAKAYRNGGLITTADISGLGDISSTSEFRIGKSSANRPFTGEIPLAMVYNRVLSQSEITQNFNAHRSRFGI